MPRGVGDVLELKSAEEPTAVVLDRGHTPRGLDLAVGLRSEFRKLDVSLARERIRAAARRAGMTEGEAARAVRAALTDGGDGADKG